MEIEVQPSVPSEGPLFELFSETLKIAENHALTAEETWELVNDLFELYNQRGIESFDIDHHPDESGGLYDDPDNPFKSHETLSNRAAQYLDTYYPLLDSTSILANSVTIEGGTHFENFNEEETHSLTSDELDE